MYRTYKGCLTNSHEGPILGLCQQALKCCQSAHILQRMIPSLSRPPNWKGIQEPNVGGYRQVALNPRQGGCINQGGGINRPRKSIGNLFLFFEISSYGSLPFII